MKKSFGVDFYANFLDYIENGNVKEGQLKELAFSMHPYVVGIFEDLIEEEKPLDIVWKEMLKCWFEEDLAKNTINPKWRLREILEKSTLKSILHDNFGETLGLEILDINSALDEVKESLQEEHEKLEKSKIALKKHSK